MLTGVQGGLSCATGVNLKPQPICVKAAEKNPIIRCKSSTEYRGYCLLVVAIYIILPVTICAVFNHCFLFKLLENKIIHA